MGLLARCCLDSRVVCNLVRDHTHEQGAHFKPRHARIGSGYVHWTVFCILLIWELGYLVIELPDLLPKRFDRKTMGLLDVDGTVNVPAFGGILFADGQQVGTLTLYKHVPSMTAYCGLCVALVTKPAFCEADFFHAVVPLDA